MSRKFYCPVDVSNQYVSKEVKKWYCSVGGVSKKVKKAYCSVDGLSKLFYEDGGGGGITVDFEHYYSSGGTYSVHNYLTLSEVMDVCYATYLQYVGTYPSTYPHIQYFIDHWQEIKSAILDKVDRAHLSIANTQCRISSMKSGQDIRTIVTLYLNNYLDYTTTDPFPMVVKINRQQTSSLGLIRYTIQPTPNQPPQNRSLVTDVYDGSYSVGSVTSMSSNVNFIGYNSYDNTGTYAVYFASFGMKKV